MTTSREEEEHRRHLKKGNTRTKDDNKNQYLKDKKKEN